MAVCILAVAAMLQGCSQHCGDSFPVTGFELDIEHLDSLAGCIKEFSWLWGYPCASDVPVLFSKKGIIPDADKDFLAARVEQEYYQCLQWSADGGRYCQHWTATEHSCQEESFGECYCVDGAESGNYCNTWQCISKEAEQHMCWASCCGDNCQPCVLCGEHGSSPFTMDKHVYDSLMEQEGVSLGMGEAETIETLRVAHYGAYTFQGECISSRDIHYPAEIPCGSWREIETELMYCVCHNAPDEEYCKEWSCEDKDVGLFSILFHRPMNYQPYVDGIEHESYQCLETETNHNGGTSCSHWVGDILGWKEVETTQCRACDGDGGCSFWKCDEYEAARIHPEDQWWLRGLWFMAHMLWMACILMTLDVMGVGTCAGDDGPKGDRCLGAVGSLCMLFVSIFLIYSLAFLRWEVDHGRWRAPMVPLMSLCGVLLATWPLGLCLELGTGLFPALVFFPIFMAVNCVWAIGVVGLVVILVAIGCCVALVVSASSGSKAEASGSGSETDKPAVMLPGPTNYAPAEYVDPGRTVYDQEWLLNPNIQIMQPARH